MFPSVDDGFVTDEVGPVGRDYFLRLLGERDEHLADLYTAGVRLFDMARFGGRSRLLAHAVREVRRDLPALFAQTKKPKKLEHHPRLEKIAERWNSEVRPQLVGLASIASPPNGITMASDPPLMGEPALSVPSGIASDIDSLIVEDAAVSATLRQQFLEMCNEVNREVLRWGGNPHLARRWMSGLKAAESLAHKGGGHADEERAESLFRELERLVLLIFRPATERERIARELANSATPDSILDALAMLVTMPDHTVFYENLRRADVLPKLQAANVFRIAGGEAEPTYWPEAAYLANVAADNPSAVADILASLRATNRGVVRQLLAAATRLPDSHLATVAKRAEWLGEAQSVTLYGGYVDVMRRLALAGKFEAAFKLGASLLRLGSEPDTLGEFFGHRDRAVPLVGANSFEDALRGVVSALGSVDPIRTMMLLADTLDSAIAIERMDEHDMSSTWLPDVLDADAGRYFAPGQAGGALARLSIEAAEERPEAVLAFLDARSAARVYERIALAVIFSRGLATRAAERLLDGPLWLRRGPEHLRVVEAFYPGLTVGERVSVFKIACAALEPWYRSWLVDPEAPRDDDEDRVLANLGVCFGRAIDAVPEPFGSRLRAAIDATRPATLATPPEEDALAAMSPRDAVVELRRWEASAPPDEPWGLGQVIWRLIERDTAKWLADGTILALSDRYLGWALHGLRNQRNASKPLYDATVLAVLEDAVRRAEALASRGSEEELHEARALAQPAAITLADLARDAADAETLERIVAAAGTVGRMAVTPAVETQGSPAQAPAAALGDPHALAVNIAGEALKAAARLGLAEKTTILDLYDEHTRDSTLTVRAALGGDFAFFAGWDDRRAGSWAVRIFLSGDERADQAAWAGYVLHSQLTRVTYRLLRSAYVLRIGDMRRTAARASDITFSARSEDGRQVHEKTLAHAWVLAWNREEPVEADGSLIRLALDAASPALVVALLGIVGRDLARPGTDPKVSAAIASEAMRLWARVRAGVEADRHPADVLRAFASWTRSTILPALWRLREVEWLMNVSDIDLPHEWDLVQGLIDLAADDMNRALRALRDLARRRDVAAMTAMSEYAGPLLLSARAAGSESRLLAVEINSILMNNFYRDLLDGPTG